MVLRNRLSKKIGIIFIALVMALGVLPAAGGSKAFAGEKDSIGTMEWSQAIPHESYCIAAPVVYNGAVFVANGCVLYKYDAATGQLLGEADITPGTGNNVLAPTVAGDKILVALRGATASKADGQVIEGTNPRIAVVDAETLEVNCIDYTYDQTGYQSLTPIAYDEETGMAYAGSYSVTKGGTYSQIDLSKVGTEEEASAVTELVDSAKGFYWAGACTDGDFVVFGEKSTGTNDGHTPYDGTAAVYAYSKATGKVGKLKLSKSGSFCSTVQYANGYYYALAKSGKLYRLKVKEDAEGVTITSKLMITLSGITTCTPVIDGKRLYVGGQTKDFKYGRVWSVTLETGALYKTYSTPGDVKFIKLFRTEESGLKIYATYNIKNSGGIYEATAGYYYFMPPTEMRQYCISSIAAGDETDSMLYYVNDSSNLMAVKKTAASFAPPAKLYAPKVIKKDRTHVKVSWTPKGEVKGYQVARSSYKSKSYTTVATVSGEETSAIVYATRKKARYYKVRPYRLVGNNRVYGSWSTPKKYTLK